MTTAITPNQSLLQYLDVTQVTCLNEAPEHGVRGIFEDKVQNTSEKYLLSDADEQLLINIAFNQRVRVKSILIRTSSVAQAPKKIRLFTNRQAIGFEDVEDAQEPDAAQVLELSEEEVSEGRPIKLKFVRFQSLESLHIFVESNQGDEDETRIDAIDIYGDTLETTKDLSSLRRQEE